MRAPSTSSLPDDVERLGDRGRLLTPVGVGTAVVIGAAAATDGSRHILPLSVLAGAVFLMGLGFQWFDLSWLPLRYMSGVTVTVPVIVVVLSLSGARGAAPSVMIVLSAVLYALMLGLGTAVAAALLGGIPLVVLQWSAEGPRAAVMGTAVTVVALVMSWAAGGLRRASETAARQAAEALAAAAQAEAQVQAEREQRERDKAAEAARALVEREQKVTQLVERITRLSQSSDNVREEAQNVAAAAEEMSVALQEIGRAAQTSESVTAQVTDRARDADRLMTELSTSSAEITAASDVIQAIAQQTNLLALNATIESARAGEAGRGFAVAATEVKELASQSGDNADRITRTLDAVRTQVGASVSSVATILESMGELARYNGTLAAALEEQGTVVNNVVQSVTATARATAAMADDITALRVLAVE